MGRRSGDGDAMNIFRGIILIAAGCYALYRGWVVHSGSQAWWAYGLGVVAIAIGIWRMIRNPDRPLV